LIYGEKEALPVDAPFFQLLDGPRQRRLVDLQPPGHASEVSSSATARRQ
jgi:hypothetical protein